VNRYLVALSLVAPLIAETVQSSGEAKLSAERISDLYGAIEKLESAAERCSLPKNLTKDSDIKLVKLSDINCRSTAAGNKDGSALSFESLSFEVNKSLSDALKQAFDNLNIRANANQIIALEPTEILKTVLKARHLVPVLLRYLSSFRDISIIFGLSIADSCNNTLYPKLEGTSDLEIIPDPDQSKVDKAVDQSIVDTCKKVAEDFGKLIDRSRTLDSDVAGDERPIKEIFNSGKKALNAGLDWEIDSKHRIALLHHVNRACRTLDALAKIDHSGFKGCTISLTEKTAPDGSNEDAQKAVNILTK
jgi:hypothetical protein